MKKITAMFCVLISTVATLAAEPRAAAQNEQVGPSAQEIEDLYIFQCGSIDETIKLINGNSKDLTDSDINEIIEMRKINLSIIREGKPAIIKLLDEGSKNNTGNFGALLACGVVVQISEKVKERGCLDLKTNEVVKDGAGLSLCEEMLSLIKK